MPYERPNLRRALGQVATSFLPYFLLWGVMIVLYPISYALTMLVAIPAAGFLIRTFIISHDCGHGSFFASRRANDVVGYISSLLTFTPYHYWRHNHAVHHATSGNLDRRGVGDVWTLTLSEYRALPRAKRLGYRLHRNPFVMFLLGPVYMFLIRHRFAIPGEGARWHRSVFLANLSLLGIAVSMSLLIGWKAYVLIQLPVLLGAGVAGVWLFYLQHQYGPAYWERSSDWDYLTSAMRGSSYYALPKFLQWWSGNIGFHHVHHLSPKVPNYFLEKCHRENPAFHSVETLTLKSSLRCVGVRVWDEEKKAMVGIGPFWL